MFRTLYERYFLFAVYRKLAKSMSFCVRKVDFSAHLNFYRTIEGKPTFRTQNDTDEANFQCTADKKIFFLLADQKVHAFTPHGAKKSIFDSQVEKKSYATREKHFLYSCDRTSSEFYVSFFRVYHICKIYKWSKMYKIVLYCKKYFVVCALWIVWML